MNGYKMTTQRPLLAGDLGGTKTWLRLSCGGELMREQRYDSAAFSGLTPMIADFLAETVPESACFGVAGFDIDNLHNLIEFHGRGVC